MQQYLMPLVVLVAEMAPYLLLGFLIAGLLHAFVPRTVYARYLSGNDFRSVVLAALFGVPLPLCSCGVIPTAMSMRREGASHAATVSFLIATPQTGVDSIAATASLLGLPFALLRPLAALVTALGGGALVGALARNEGQIDAAETTETPLSTSF
ncbi:MAG: permease, partial [Alistipes sp.]|nr:permease [Alistipes sp.]